MPTSRVSVWLSRMCNTQSLVAFNNNNKKTNLFDLCVYVCVCNYCSGGDGGWWGWKCEWLNSSSLWTSLLEEGCNILKGRQRETNYPGVFVLFLSLSHTLSVIYFHTSVSPPHACFLSLSPPLHFSHVPCYACSLSLLFSCSISLSVARSRLQHISPSLRLACFPFLCTHSLSLSLSLFSGHVTAAPVEMIGGRREVVICIEIAWRPRQLGRRTQRSFV